MFSIWCRKHCNAIRIGTDYPARRVCVRTIPDKGLLCPLRTCNHLGSCSRMLFNGACTHVGEKIHEEGTVSMRIHNTWLGLTLAACACLSIALSFSFQAN